VNKKLCKAVKIQESSNNSPTVKIWKKPVGSPLDNCARMHGSYKSDLWNEISEGKH